MKNIIIIGLLIGMLFLTGCYSTVRTAHPVFFDDLNSSVDNYKYCYDKLKMECDNTISCRSFHITLLECEDGKCFCD